MNQDKNNSPASQLPLDIEVIDDYSDSQLAKEKVSARKRLLAMPPESAQKLVDMTLLPQCWEFKLSNQACVWDETIPTSYGEDNYTF